jgi:hypothetical protein
MRFVQNIQVIQKYAYPITPERSRNFRMRGYVLRVPGCDVAFGVGPQQPTLITVNEE